MKIFLSHSSDRKPLIREVRRYWPQHIRSWLDENDIVIGDSISRKLKNAISAPTDYLVLFLDLPALQSKWIEQEIQWALEQERKFKRTIVLPVVLNIKAWEKINIKEIRDRKYIKCTEFDELSVKNLSNRLIAEFFSLLSREMEIARSSPTKQSRMGILDEAEAFMSRIAEAIQRNTFMYRRNNPLDIWELKERISNEDGINQFTNDEFVDVLCKLTNRGYLSGIVFDGSSIHVVEEHFNWKTKMNTSKKCSIAAKAVQNIVSGDLIALDSGSTTLEVAKSIAFAIKHKRLTGMRLITNSLAASKALIDTLCELELDEENDVLKIYLVGGIIRPNTQAIVDIEGYSNNGTSFQNLYGELGKPSIGFVGVNGVHFERGFTTHINSEAQVKRDIVEEAEKVYLLADESKFGIVEEMTFCSFDENVTLITNRSEIALEYEKHFKLSKASMVISDE